jgi:predicted MPP superfamily phosphohydrolase
MAYVFCHLWYAGHSRKGWKIFISCLFSVLLSGYLVGFFLHQQLNDTFLYFLLSAYGIWYVAVIYFALFLFVIDVVWMVHRFFPIYPPWVRKHYRNIKIGLLSLIAGTVSFFLCYGYYSFLHPKIKHQTIHINKKAEQIDTLRIAFVADIHAGYIVNREHLKKFVDLINAQSCDMILLGGDMIDYDMHILNVQQMDVEFRRLKAPGGVYAILGNHEHRFNTAKRKEWLEKCGIIVLQDSVAMPEMSFYLIGRDDKHNKQRKSLDYLLAGLDKNKPLILADHQPFNVGEALMHGIDFMISGHTHNGQIWPNTIWINWLFDGFGEGYKRKGHTQFYISSGLGVSGPPFRIFTDSEIVVFEIVFAP